MTKGHLSLLLIWIAVVALTPTPRIYASPGSEAGESMENSIPLKMELYSGGYLSGGVAVVLKDGAVQVRRTGPSGEEGHEKTVTPGVSAWKAFRLVCDLLNIWDWKETYVDRNIMDGHQWSIDLVYPDKTLKSSGSNSYPPGGQSIASGRTPEFIAFWYVVDGLTKDSND